MIFLYLTWIAIVMWRCAPNVKYKVFHFLGRLVSALLAIVVLGNLLRILQVWT